MAKVIEFYVPKNFRKPVKMGSSAAARKSYRVLFADKEISLAQQVCWPEAMNDRLRQRRSGKSFYLSVTRGGAAWLRQEEP